MLGKYFFLMKIEKFCQGFILLGLSENKNMCLDGLQVRT